jgi:pyruvate dehydrogenase kinase 2/3/4
MTETIERFYHRHTPVVVTIARAVLELKKLQNIAEIRHHDELHHFLDLFFTARINVRMLVQQHVEMFGTDKTQNISMIGIIDPKCKPVQVVSDAVASAKILCDQTFGVSPNVEVFLPTGDVQFSYIPGAVVKGAKEWVGYVFVCIKNPFL